LRPWDRPEREWQFTRPGRLSSAAFPPVVARHVNHYEPNLRGKPTRAGGVVVTHEGSPPSEITWDVAAKPRSDVISVTFGPMDGAGPGCSEQHFRLSGHKFVAIENGLQSAVRSTCVSAFDPKLTLAERPDSTHCRLRKDRARQR